LCIATVVINARMLAGRVRDSARTRNTLSMGFLNDVFEIVAEIMEAPSEDRHEVTLVLKAGLPKAIARLTQPAIALAVCLF
jgi:hypothetical protein